jgi:hypothetical protein
MMTEPDVTLTDYALVIECAALAYLVYRQGGQQQSLSNWFALFFGSIGLAALTGGTVHGFFLDEESIGYRILWPATLIAGGLAALSTWTVAAYIQFSKVIARWISFVAIVEFAGYSVLVLLVTQEFWIVIVNYLPATIFLLAVFLRKYLLGRESQLLAGTVGLLFTFAAAGVQQGQVALHPVYFNHNALYHLIQAVALLLIFWSARSLVSSRRR